MDIDDDDFWMDLVKDSTTGQFKWNGIDEPATFTNWKDGSPGSGGFGYMNCSEECLWKTENGYDRNVKKDYICQYNTVDGMWSSWSEWYNCTTDTSGQCQTDDIQIRNRTCDNPAPDLGGDNCTNDSVQHNTLTCTEGSISIVSSTGESCWYFLQEDFDYDQAVEACRVVTEAPAATLAVIDSQELFDILQGIDLNAHNIDGDKDHYIGLKYHSDDSQYKWPSGQTLGEWTMWRYGDTPTEPSEACVKADPDDNWRWKVEDCTDQRYAICEYGRVVIDGGWNQWTSWTECNADFCSEGNITRSRSCDNPAPKNGGLDCVGDILEIDTCYNNSCPINGNWTEWSVWSNCSYFCQTYRTRECTNPPPQYFGNDCEGSFNESKMCTEKPCNKKFTIPAGAYVRNADYYWSFNEWVDSGALQIFQNTGEYSFGLFNASASYIQQNNDSIDPNPNTTARSWYTVKFNKLKNQCIQIPGFNNENHTCIVQPSTCPDGLSMEIWLKLQQSDFESKTIQTLVASGNTQDSGHGGFFTYQTGRTVAVLIANGTHYWFLEKNLPSSIAANQWFNFAFRWRSDKGVQLFINGKLLEEIPFARVKEEPQLPADNKLYVGCRKKGLSLTDYTDVEMDELAFWRMYLPDAKLKWFTGAMIEETELSESVFQYKKELELLSPPPAEPRNPYYEIADIYEPCDNTVTDFGASALVNISRGHGEGIFVPEITDDTEIVINDAVIAQVADLNSADVGLSMSFWVYPDITDAVTHTLFSAANWEITLDSGNITLKACYQTVARHNESLPLEDVVYEDIITLPLSSQVWSNFAFTFIKNIGVDIYINGVKKTSDASLTRTEKTAVCTGTMTLKLMKSSDNITVSDIIVWTRYLYPFESYRFMGMSPSESYLNSHADFYWSTDYYVALDQTATKTLKPLYKTKNSSVSAVSNSGIHGGVNKGQAMEVTDKNGWVMLGLDPEAQVAEDTGAEFAGTCLSDPDLCTDGVTLALWLKLYSVPADEKRYYIITSGEEDEKFSRGFSIILFKQEIHVALVDGKKYYRVALTPGQFQVDQWMHLAFTWRRGDGLWVFVNGELMGANKDGTPQIRNYDRYNRITLGRSNANNIFGGFVKFAFQEIAVYLRFSVTYRIRELFALAETKHYARAKYYYSKEALITNKLTNLQTIPAGSVLGPLGTVNATNNTISLGEEGRILLKYVDSGDCTVNPTNCANGITVSAWARNNRLMQTDEQPVFVVSSHQHPENVISGDTQGWTIYFLEKTWWVAVTAGQKLWKSTISELAKPLLAQRWTNLAFTWSLDNGLTLLLDGKVAAILKNGVDVTGSAPEGDKQTMMVGHISHPNITSIDVYNVGLWEEFYYGTKANELTGHTVEVMDKYSSANLMWTFDGPIHMVNTKYSEMRIPLETYDNTLKGAAIQVTRDGLNSAQLGNYTSECVTQPSSCKAGFQLGAKLKLAKYRPGEGEDAIGSILLLGSPDVDFEGLAIQLIREDGVNKIKVLVANDKYTWSRQVTVFNDVWFDFVLGWNVQDGIAIKLDNKKINEGGQQRIPLPIGSSKLVTNNLILGVGSGGGTNGAIEAAYNDITVTYNSKVTVEQEGRCFDTATLYYRLNKGQIFTMEDVTYVKDRENIVESAFLLDGGYVELDQFKGLCFSDPSQCTEDGMSLSMYVKVFLDGETANRDSAQTLLSTGYPATRGYQIVVAPLDDSNGAAITVLLSDGDKEWKAQGPVEVNKWVNVAFVWKASDGLAVYLDGVFSSDDSNGKVNTMPEKTDRAMLVIGRGNDVSDADFSSAAFDDIALWDSDLRVDLKLSEKLRGKDCGGEEAELIKEAEVLEVADTTVLVAGTTTTNPPGCNIYDAINEVCADDTLALAQQISNGTMRTKVNKLAPVMDVVKNEIKTAANLTTVSSDNIKAYSGFIKGMNDLDIDEEVDPRESKVVLMSALEITLTVLDPKHKDAWKEINSNSSNGAPDLLKNLEALALRFTKNTQMGFDKEDDCSAFPYGTGRGFMSNEKRRLALCSRPFLFPQYDIMEADPELNQTLANMDKPTDRVEIPIETWPRRDYADDTEVTVSVIVMAGEDIKQVFPTEISLERFVDLEATTSADNPKAAIDTEQVKKATIESRVISISVSPPVRPPLKECVKITLEHNTRNTGNKRVPHCAFWDHKAPETPGGAWSSEGVDLEDSNETHTVCCSYHLTSFAIMMEPLVEEVIDDTAQKISYIKYGCIGLSLLSLFIFCLVILCNKSLRSERNMVHLNLSVSMILATGSYLAAEFAKDEPVYCQAAAIAQHYFFMVAYCWILIESLCLFYAVLYGVLMGRMKCYAPLGWLLPAAIVVLCVGLYHERYGTNDKCWPTYNDWIVMAMLGPILLAILLDIVVLLIIICNLPQPTLKREDILSEVRWAVFYALLVAPVFVFIWLIALMDVLKIELPSYFTFIYSSMFSLQGFFVFLVYGLGQRSVRHAIMRKKYQPTFMTSRANSRLMGGSSNNSSQQNVNDFVEVKPQPMSRPSSRSSKGSKDKSSPRPPPRDVTPPDVHTTRRRSSTVSVESSGYIP